MSAVVVQAKLLAAFACFESTWFCSNVCKMDNHPPARRPHKSPAHTVKDPGNRPQRLASVPVGVSPQGAAHDSAVFAFVNTPRESPDASLQLAGREAVSSKGAAHSSPDSGAVNTALPFPEGPGSRCGRLPLPFPLRGAHSALSGKFCKAPPRRRHAIVALLDAGGRVHEGAGSFPMT